MCSTWLKYQNEIGHDKLCLSVTGFELDVEDKGLIKQRMYEEYSIYCSESVVKTWLRSYMVKGLVSLRSAVPLLSILCQPGKILCHPTQTLGTN